MPRAELAEVFTGKVHAGQRPAVALRSWLRIGPKSDMQDGQSGIQTLPSAPQIIWTSGTAHGGSTPLCHSRVHAVPHRSVAGRGKKSELPQWSRNPMLMSR